MDTSYPKSLTVHEADKALRFFLNQYHEEHGLNLNEDLFHPFMRELSYRLNADFRVIYVLEEAIEALEELAQVEAGTHPELHENAVGTVSNREELTEAAEIWLNRSIDDALMGAKFDTTKLHTKRGFSWAA
ncbi:MAG: hypothetical protein L0G87_04520 [Renibacterium salmoninarum]|nr:hypothetical protein [Renibacterium salmoninarum]